MGKTDALGTKSIGKLLWEFSLPAIVGMLVNSLYNIVARIFIGNSVAADAGSLGLTALTISFPLMIIMMALALLFGVGGSVVFSIKMGKQKEKDAKEVMGATFAVLITIAIIVSVIALIFLEPILKAFGASDAAMPLAKSYMQIILLGSVFQFVSTGGNNFLRASGSPKIAMFSLLIGAGYNIVSDVVLISILGMGVKGAAISTICGQALSTLWVVLYLTNKKREVRLEISDLKLKFPLTFSIAKTGLPVFFTQISTSLMNIVLNKSLMKYGALAGIGGDLAVSGIGIIISIQTLILMPIIGVAQGLGPIVGYNYGANQLFRCKEALKKSIVAATIISIVGFIFIFFMPHRIAEFFSKDPHLVDFTANSMVIWFALTPLWGFQNIGANYLQSVGKSVAASTLTLSKQILFLIPLVYMLSRVLGIKGILLASPGADILTTVLTVILLYRELKKYPIQDKCITNN